MQLALKKGEPLPGNLVLGVKVLRNNKHKRLEVALEDLQAVHLNRL